MYAAAIKKNAEPVTSAAAYSVKVNKKKPPLHPSKMRNKLAAKILQSKMKSESNPRENETTNSEWASGNYIMDFRLSHSRPNAALKAGVIQRTVTQISMEEGESDEPVVKEVAIIGRPPKVYGDTMGDHSTAFGVQVHAVKSRLMGKTLTEAIRGMRELVEDLKDLPGTARADDLPPAQRDKLLLAWAQLKSIDSEVMNEPKPPSKKIEEADVSEMEIEKTEPEAVDTKSEKLLPVNIKNIKSDKNTRLAVALQEYVNAYLEVRELIPFSTINVRAKAPALAGKGKGESKHLKVLAGGEKDEEKIKTAVMGLLDTKSVSMVASEADEELKGLMAPGIDTKKDPVEVVEMFINQHFTAIKQSFPDTAAVLDEIDIKKFITENFQKLLENDFKEMYNEQIQEWQKLEGWIIKKASDADNNNPRIKKKPRAEIPALKKEQTELKAACESIKDQMKDLKINTEGLASFPESTTDDSGLLLKKRQTEVKYNFFDPSDIKSKKTKASKPKNKPAEVVKVESGENKNKQTLGTQIILDPAGRITEMLSEGRSPTPFASSEGMGAHTTAWTVHLDFIRKTIVGKEVNHAIALIRDVLVPEALAEAKKREANFKSYEGQKEKLDQAEAELKKFGGSIKTDDKLPQVFQLQDYINLLLTYKNFIPGATLPAADTGGKSEGKHRRTLMEGEEKLMNGIEPTREDYSDLEKAKAGLLDLGSVSSREQIKALRTYHNEIIQKTYPKVAEFLAGKKPESSMNKKRGFVETELDEALESSLPDLKRPKPSEEVQNLLNKDEPVKDESMDFEKDKSSGEDHPPVEALKEEIKEEAIDTPSKKEDEIKLALAIGHLDIDLPVDFKELYAKLKQSVIPMEEDYQYTDDSLVDQHGEFKNAQRPRAVNAYREDVANSSAYLTEAEGHIIAVNEDITVEIYRNAPPAGFTEVANPGGGNCLLHSIYQARERINNRPPGAGAPTDFITASRGHLAANLQKDDIITMFTAAVFARMEGGYEPGLGPRVRALLNDPAVQNAKPKPKEVAKESGKEESSGMEVEPGKKEESSESGKSKEGESQKEESGKKNVEAQPVALGPLSTLGNGAAHANVVIVYKVSSAHYVMAYRNV